MNEAIVRMRNPVGLYQEACRIAIEDGLFRMAWIGLVDPDTQWVKPLARWGIHEGYLETVNASTREDLAVGRGPTGTCIRTQAILADPFEPWGTPSQIREGIVRRLTDETGQIVPSWKRPTPYGCKTPEAKQGVSE